MSTESLKIIIGADVSKGVAGLNDLNKALATTGTASAKTAAALGKVQPGAAQAGTALTNLSRVAQDAPFGFIAIQNNLDPLIESFGRLKNESGSTGAALKTLGSALIGPAGVGLAFAAVSSLITSAIQKYGSLSNAINSIFGNLSSLEKANQALNKAQQESNKHAGEEIARLQILSTVAADVTRSTQQRNTAAKELQDILKVNNVELSKEAILNGDVATAIDKATESILKRARARAVESRLAELQTQRLNLEIKEAQALTNLSNKQAQFNKELQAGRFDERSRGFFLRTAVDELDDVRGELKKVDDQIKFTVDRINTDQVDPIAIDHTKAKKDVDLLKQRIEVLKELQGLTGLDSNQQVELVQLEIQLARRDAVKLGFTQTQLQQKIEGILERSFPVKTFSFDLEAQPDLKLLPAKIPNNIDVAKALNLEQIPIDFAGPIVERMKAIGEKMKELKLAEQAKETAEAVANVLTPAFDGLFNAILNGQNAFTAVGDAVKRLVSDMAKAIIRAAALAAIFSLIFPSGKGGLNFLGAFKKFLGGGFKDGGISTGPQSGYLALLHGTELIIPMNKVGQTNSSNIQGAALDMPVILQPSVAIQGQALRILLNRVDTTNGRLF